MMLTMLTIHVFMSIRIVFLMLIIISHLKIKFLSSLATKDPLHTCVLTIDKERLMKMVVDENGCHTK